MVTKILNSRLTMDRRISENEGPRFVCVPGKWYGAHLQSMQPMKLFRFRPSESETTVLQRTRGDNTIIHGYKPKWARQNCT